jgi:osmotically-inducible protein OsmY
VFQQLEWETEVTSTDVGVSVDDGVATLSGFVASYAEKLAAERAAKRAYGVLGIANDLEVRPQLARTDPEIAKAAIHALHAHVVVPEEALTVTVRDGWITLEGTVEREVERRAAAAAVRDLIGVRGVSNEVTVAAHAASADVKRTIEAALRRNSQLDARRIVVEAHGGAVTLRGTVGSRAEEQEIVRVARSAPGVTSVETSIRVLP